MAPQVRPVVWLGPFALALTSLSGCGPRGIDGFFQDIFLALLQIAFFFFLTSFGTLCAIFNIVQLSRKAPSLVWGILALVNALAITATGVVASRGTPHPAAPGAFMFAALFLYLGFRNVRGARRRANAGASAAPGLAPHPKPPNMP